MRLETKKYLYDINRAIALLIQFTANKTFVDYRQDAMLRAAVERELGIIGEAVARLARLERTVVARISEYQRIIAFRNVLIHSYADVDDRLVWDLLETKIPTLARDIDSLLKED